MKTWFVRTLKKSSPGMVGIEVRDAPTAEEAAGEVEGGPVRFLYRDEEYSQFVGVGYLYEVKEL